MGQYEISHGARTVGQIENTTSSTQRLNLIVDASKRKIKTSVLSST